MKIAVAGTGYVGLSIATLLAQHHEVVAVDVIPEKVEKINNRISPIQDDYIEKYFAEKSENLKAAGNVERKSDYMADVADRIETTQHKVDALTIGVALASALVFAAVSVVILSLGKGNDLILAREGAEKKNMAREKLNT